MTFACAPLSCQPPLLISSWLISILTFLSVQQTTNGWQRRLSWFWSASLNICKQEQCNDFIRKQSICRRGVRLRGWMIAPSQVTICLISYPLPGTKYNYMYRHIIYSINNPGHSRPETNSSCRPAPLSISLSISVYPLPALGGHRCRSLWSGRRD